MKIKRNGCEKIQNQNNFNTDDKRNVITIIYENKICGFAKRLFSFYRESGIIIAVMKMTGFTNYEEMFSQSIG
ncbi:MAG: hypothetical protein KH216_08350, partial [Clostridiales bacterium]|nr:hypothetical protein [Clostridiales bacterium]